MASEVLITGDLHLSIRPVLGRDRFKVYQSVMRQIRTIAQGRGIRKVILNGDVLDSKHRISIELLMWLYGFLLEKDGLTWIISRGNHESPRRDDPEWSVLRMFSRVATVVCSPEQVLLEASRHAYVLPWYPADEYFERLKAIPDQPTGTILISHVGLREGTVSRSNFHPPSKVGVEDLFAFRDWPMVLLGDYHAAQRVGNRPAFYLGAPIPHTFGDVANLGVWVLNCENLNMKALPLEAPAFRTWEVKASEDLPLVGYVASDYNRVRAIGSLVMEVQRTYPDAVVLKFDKAEASDETIEESRMSLSDLSDVGTLIEQWVRYKDAQEEEALIALGRRLLAEYSSEATED